MKTRIGHFTLAATLAVLPLVASGCTTILGQAQEPLAPKKVPAPDQPIFDANENITKGLALPGVWRMVSATSGELVTVQSVTTTKKGTADVKQYGVPETMRLAGIVTPALGQPGYESTTKKVNEWLRGKEDLTIEQDPKWPVDLDNRRMVQIYFKPSIKGRESETWNLNRMLIHTGYAVVDMVSATSIDLQKWLFDEMFARQFVDPKTGKRKPLGLWGLGIVIPARESVSGLPGVPAPIADTTATSSTRTVISGAANTTTSTTATTSTTTGNAPIRGIAPTPSTSTLQTRSSARVAPTSTNQALPANSVGVVNGKVAYRGPRGKLYYLENGQKRYFSQDRQ